MFSVKRLGAGVPEVAKLFNGFNDSTELLRIPLPPSLNFNRRNNHIDQIKREEHKLRLKTN